MRTSAIALLAGTAIAASASAGPDPLNPNRPSPSKVRRAIAPVTAPVGTPDACLVDDNFDSYAAGSTIAGQGGWETWFTTGPDTEVVSPSVCTALFTACPSGNSGSNSLLYKSTFSDIVQYWPAGAYTTGQYELTAYVYVPSGLPSVSPAYIIMLNTYTQQPGGGGNESWSLQTHFEPGFGNVQSDVYFQGSTHNLPLVTDQWVEYRAFIDLDANTLEEWYDGQVLIGAGGPGGQTGPGPWFGGTLSSAGVQQIQCLDIFSNGGDSMFIDDIKLCEAAAGCYPDCDGSGMLDLFDFLCFVNEFNNGNPYADCDGSGTLDLFDFLCFVNEFNNGCP